MFLNTSFWSEIYLLIKKKHALSNLQCLISKMNLSFLSTTYSSLILGLFSSKIYIFSWLHLLEFFNTVIGGRGDTFRWSRADGKCVLRVVVNTVSWTLMMTTMTRHEWCCDDDNIVRCAPPSGLMSHLTDFLQHLLRLQLLQSQQGQTQLVLLQHRAGGLVKSWKSMRQEEMSQNSLLTALLHDTCWN